VESKKMKMKGKTKMIKKCLSYLVFTALIMGLLPSWNVNAAVWSALSKDDGTTRLGILSDSHMIDTNPNDGGTERFRSALDAFKTIGNVDGLALVGDIIYQNDSTQNIGSRYSALNNILAEKFPNETNPSPLTTQNASSLSVIYAMGNHEYPQGVTASVQPDLVNGAQTMFREKTGQDSACFTKIVNGYTFITANAIDYKGIMSEENETAIQSAILAAITDKQSTKPVFLALHHPIQNTTLGSLSVNYSQGFIDFLMEYPQIVVLTAHMHNAVQHPKNIWQSKGGFTAISTPMLGNSYIDLYADVAPTVENISQSMLLEVSADNIVTIRRMDLLNQQFIGETWSFDIKKMVHDEEDAYPYAENEREKTAITPEFSTSAVISTTAQTENSVTISYPQPVDPDTNDDNFIISYQVTVTNATTYQLVKSFTVASDYYKLNRTTEMEVALNGLGADQAYNVEITAITAYGKESAPLIGQVTSGKATEVNIPGNTQNSVKAYVTNNVDKSSSMTIYFSDNPTTAAAEIHSGASYIVIPVNLPSSGEYDIYINYRTADTNAALYVNPDCADSASIGVPQYYNTSNVVDLQTRRDIKMRSYIFDRGYHEITLKASSGVVCVNNITLVKTNDKPVIDKMVKSTYHSGSLGITYPTGTTYGGGFAFINSTVSFPVVADKAGTYDLEVIAGSNGTTVSAKINGTTQLSNVSYNSGGFTAFKKIKLGDITLVKGYNKVDIVCGSSTLYLYGIKMAYQGEDYLRDELILTGMQYLETNQDVSGGYMGLSAGKYATYSITPAYDGIYAVWLNFGSAPSAIINVSCREASILTSHTMQQSSTFTGNFWEEICSIPMLAGQTYDIKVTGATGTSSIYFRGIRAGRVGNIDNYTNSELRANVGTAIAGNVLSGSKYGTTNWYLGYDQRYVDIDLNIVKEGVYDLGIYAGATNANIDFFIDGELLSNKTINTGDATICSRHSFGEKLLRSGVHRFTVATTTSGTSALSLNWITLLYNSEVTSDTPFVMSWQADKYAATNSTNIAVETGTLQPYSNGVILGKTDIYVDYVINVPAGNYYLSVYQLNQNHEGNVTISVNNEITGSYVLPCTSTWTNSYVPHKKEKLGVVCLREGVNTLRFTMGANTFGLGSFMLAQLEEPVTEVYFGKYISSENRLADLTNFTDSHLIIRGFLGDDQKDRTVQMISCIYKDGSLYKIVSCDAVTATLNTALITAMDSVIIEAGSEYMLKVFYWSGLNGNLQPVSKYFTFGE